MLDWGESLHELLHESILGFAESAWAFIHSAFTVGEIEGAWWVPVIGGTITTEVEGGETSVVEHPGMLNVMTRALLPVLAIFVAFQMLISALRGSSAGFLRALGTAMFAVPATYILAGLMYLVLRGVDQATLWILDQGAGSEDSEEVVMSAVLNLFGLTHNPDTGEVLMDESYQQWEMAANSGEPGQILMPWVLMVIIWLLCLVLMAMMLFRTTVIMLLTIFLPLAVFSLALEGAKAIFFRWLSIVVALILAKPLAAAALMFGMSLASVEDSWVQLVAGMIVIVVAAALPLAMLALVSFATGGAADQIERGAVGGTQRATQKAAMPARMLSR